MTRETDDKHTIYIWITRRNLWEAFKRGGIILTLKVNWTKKDYDYSYNFAPPPKRKKDIK